MATALDFTALARPVALALLGKPNLRLSTGAELRYGRKGSLAVRLDTGQWFDHESGGGGGVLDLVIYAGEASDRAGAVRWLEAEGITDAVKARESASTACPGMTACGAGEGRATAYRQSSQSSRRASARRLWESTRPIAGTVAAAYLDARRIGHIAECPDLRILPECPHPSGVRLRAMVAAVRTVEGAMVAVHRTYLRAEGTGKADVEPSKAMLGSCRGGAVRLGPPPRERLMLGEGIESTAAAMTILGEPWAWAALSTSGLRTVRIPGSIRDLVIAADRDSNGAGQRAAGELAARVEATGRTCEVWMPDRIGDFADELMEAR